jgi:hypothetical protein
MHWQYLARAMECLLCCLLNFMWPAVMGRRALLEVGIIVVSPVSALSRQLGILPVAPLI